MGRWVIFTVFVVHGEVGNFHCILVERMVDMGRWVIFTVFVVEREWLTGGGG